MQVPVSYLNCIDHWIFKYCIINQAHLAGFTRGIDAGQAIHSLQKMIFSIRPVPQPGFTPVSCKLAPAHAKSQAGKMQFGFHGDIPVAIHLGT